MNVQGAEVLHSYNLFNSKNFSYVTSNLTFGPHTSSVYTACRDEQNNKLIKTPYFLLWKILFLKNGIITIKKLATRTQKIAKNDKMSSHNSSNRFYLAAYYYISGKILQNMINKRIAECAFTKSIP